MAGRAGVGRTRHGVEWTKEGVRSRAEEAPTHLMLLVEVTVRWVHLWLTQLGRRNYSRELTV